MLKITGLKKSYKGINVLRDLNMNVSKGDIYGFLGTNGCGKTTTMNIICNVIAKDEGKIDFDGENLKVGYLPESPALYGYMNGFEYLDFIGACCDYEGDIKERTAEVLKLTGMYQNAHRFIKGYSRGMTQRIGIAAALYANPDLLILDEPTSALDPEGRAEVMQIIGGLASSGSTIILCTHILTDVERVANRIGILSQGVMAVEGSISDIRKLFGTGTAVTISDVNPTAIIEALNELDIIERFDRESNGTVSAVAKQDVTEAELFYKIVTTLASKQIVPEGVWFKRLSLEQIYLGVSSNHLLSTLSAGGTV